MQAIKFDAVTMQDGNLLLHPTSNADYISMRRFCIEFAKGKIYDAEFTEHCKKRSLTANAYAWALINKIADNLHMSKDIVYKQMLIDYGQGGTVAVVTANSTAFEQLTKYYERIGGDDKTVHYNFWVGSSQYNAAEMAIFIDGIVAEARQLGIETLTGVDLERIKDDWQK